MRIRFPSGETARYAAIILALGGAGLTTYINRTAIARDTGINIGLIDNKYFFYAVLSFLTIGSMTIILWLIGILVQHALIAPAKVVADQFEALIARFVNLDLEVCTAADLAAISQMSLEVFGPRAATEQRNLWLFGRDELSYWKIKNSAGTIVGFYCIFRLTREGTRALRRGEFDITNCPPEYLRRDAKYLDVDIYIGGMYGTSRRVRAMVWGALNQRALAMRPRSMFARAATPDGLRLLEHSRFRPVGTGIGGIGALYSR